MDRTIKEISTMTGISRFTIIAALKQGKFPASKSGNNYIVDDASPAFVAWLAGLSTRNTRKKQDGFIHGTFTLSGPRKARLARHLQAQGKDARTKEQLIDEARAMLYQQLDQL